MKNTSTKVGRRALITGAALTAAAAAVRAQTQTPPAEPVTTLADVPLSPSVTLTVERRGEIVLIGLKPPLHPEPARSADTSAGGGNVLSIRARSVACARRCCSDTASTSRAASTWDASQAAIVAGRRTLNSAETIDFLGKSKPHLSKPIVVVVHGDTWNLGHEMYLSGDIRIAGREHALRPGREHARAVPRRRRDGALRPGGGMGQCDALYADGRSLERRGVLPDGDHAGDRSLSRGRPRSRNRNRAQNRRLRVRYRSRPRSCPRIRSSIRWKPTRCRSSTPRTAPFIGRRISSRAGVRKRKAGRPSTKASRWAAVRLRGCGRRDVRSADAHVSLQLQIHQRRHRPEIDLDVGIDLLRIDSSSPADPDRRRGCRRRPA